MSRKGFLIAATSSGSGKTTLSLGLMRLLTREGHSVQPFKCGPDYIDPQFHSQATGNFSINLDTFFSSDSEVKDLFNRYSQDKDVAIVEGVMGLFDGYSKMAGSSAELSAILGLPVILLINAASTAYSVAATIYGFKRFNPSINIVGVVFNRVSSEIHYSYLRDACIDAGAECLGFIRKDSALVTPSRHLGLTLTAREDMEYFINATADAVAEHVDIDKILSLTDLPSKPTLVIPQTLSTKIAAVANDEAFNFIYTANIDRLRSVGYEIVEFSPIHDRKLPEAEFVYIPGGYPELFAKEISENSEMIDSIRNYIEREGRLWAECGGLIYLSEYIDEFAMCGVFPLKTTMDNARLTLGYREVNFGKIRLKGHEFHYSHILNPDAVGSVAWQTNVRGKDVPTPVYRYKNALASYTHLYWGCENILNLWQQ